MAARDVMEPGNLSRKASELEKLEREKLEVEE